MSTVEIRHFHLFCGLGGGARGFNHGQARVGSMTASFRCIGGIDNDPAGLADFERLAGVPGTLLDLFSRDQHRAFHDREPGPEWREATPADFHRAAGHETPHIVFLSAPCKGYSGLLSESRSKTAKYRALNELALRGLLLALEAWADDPVPFFLFENVPRIQTRGRPLLDQIESLLAHYGYASAETTHDCGEFGGLAQSRKRFLLVARHREKVSPFLYEPTKRSLRAVGDVLGPMPLPGDELGGPMHRLPALHWRTWVRLAFVEAGSDWRSLQRLAVENGHLRDYALAPEAEYHNGSYGVRPWNEPAWTVTGNGRPASGSFSVADPRLDASRYESTQYGVTDWQEPAGTITSQRSPGQGRFAVADPRIDGHEKSVQMGVRRWTDTAPVVTGKMFAGGGPNSVADPRVDGVRHNNVFRIVRWSDVSPSVTGGTGPSSGGLNIADPRVGYGPTSHYNKLAVTRWDGSSKTVTGATQVQGGALAVADPRTRGNVYSGYGVAPWERHSRTIAGESFPSNGCFAVADPRALPAATDRLVAVIRSLDDTWHRPFTTLELAALQSLIDPEERFQLDGKSDSAWRERIGNAVPPSAAQAIASVIGQALLLAWSGETFVLGSTPIWVRDVAVAISVAQRSEAGA